MAKPAISLVFTDVVGSSAAKRAATLGADISERDRAYLEGIQAKHLKLVRTAVAEHNGKEVMTIGDSFFLTFEEPMDALRCAAAIQQQLADRPISTVRGPLKLRIGIHVGTPEYFENSWHGTDVDIAARVQSVASPQQILLTDAARERMGEPLGITLRSLGTFALKGVGGMKLWDADYDSHGVRRTAVKSRESRRILVAAVMAFNVAMLSYAGYTDGWFSAVPKPATPAAAAPAKPAEVNSIIVANFENKTGDPSLNDILTQAFTIQLEQSPILNIVGSDQLRAGMQYLGKSPSDPITPDLARQIAVRLGVKALLSGSIGKVGDGYVITATATNSNDGSVVASAEDQASDKNHVISTLSNVASTLRTKLGESLDSIQKLDTPLGQATTPSLEAFRAYSLGCAALESDKSDAARGYFQQAVDLDPNFVMAHLFLGMTESGSGIDKSDKDITFAHDHMQGLSERERFHVESLYDGQVLGNLDKGIEILNLACQTYPTDFAYRANLMSSLVLEGRLDEALAQAREAAKIQPDTDLSNDLMLYLLVSDDHLSEAKAFLADLRKKGRDDDLDAFSLDVVTANCDVAQAGAELLRKNPDRISYVTPVAAAYEFAGRYAEADEAWRHGADLAAARHRNANQAISILIRLDGRAQADLIPTTAPAEIKAALALDDSLGVRALAAWTAAICDLPEVAQPMIDALAQEHPENTLIHGVWLPQIRAIHALRQHQPQQAIDALAGNESYDLVTGSEYLRGLAYLQLKNGPEAITCFKKVTTRPGATLLFVAQDYPQAQLGLARAYAMAGDKDNAKKAYEAFFKTWKNADADLPQLVAAKKEYAELQDPALARP